ncbi:MAG TPA: HAD family phosphatase [Clostridia bacterium]|nr:HAD family phosphatase [Clostridia bacterium]
MIDSVVFDMDGVLFDTERLATDAWYKAARDMGIADIRMGVKGCVGLNHNDTMNFLATCYGDGFPCEEFMKQATRVFKEMIGREGLPVKPGVFEILNYLRENGFRIALATSTSKTGTLRHLETAGITHYFDAIVTGDMIVHGKPDPEIYELACRELGSVPENCIAVEDSPNGIRSAHGAGMKAVMVPDLIEPDEELERLLYRKFTSLFELKEFLENGMKSAKKERP